MAITGDLGGQPIQLNGAAEEYTLSRVAQAVEVLASQSGTKIDVKSLARYHTELRKLTGATSQAASATTSSSQAATNAAAAFNNAGQTVANAGAVASRTLKAFSNNAGSGADSVSASFAAIGGAANSLPGPAGKAAKALKMIATAGGAAAGVFMGAVESFEKAAQAGAGFGGDVAAARNAAYDAGVTLSILTKAVSQSSEAMSFFGGTTRLGVAAFGKINKAVIQASLGPMARFGIGASELTARTAEATEELVRAGYTVGQLANNTNLVNTQVQKNVHLQNTLAKINGTTIQQERDKQKAQRKDILLQAVIYGMDKDQQAAMKALHASAKDMSPLMAKAALEMAKNNGNLMSAGTMMLQSQNPEAMAALKDKTMQILRKENLDANDAAAWASGLDPAVHKERTRAMMDQFSTLTLAGVSNSYTEVQKESALGLLKLQKQLEGGVFDMIKKNTKLFEEEGGKMTQAMTTVATSLNNTARSLGESVTRALEEGGIATLTAAAVKKAAELAAGLGQAGAAITVEARDVGVAVLDEAKATGDAIGAALVEYLKKVMPAPKALGGPVARNRPYIVGEEGPELFISKSSGTIIPNKRGTRNINAEAGSGLLSDSAGFAEISNSLQSRIAEITAGFSNITLPEPSNASAVSSNNSPLSQTTREVEAISLKPEVEEAIIKLAAITEYADNRSSRDRYIVSDAIEKLAAAV